ncbi:uncharacterized protein LOC143068475 [Mytilus galloprovincialis]|uniref:uncharacterized protein LOC143068475 n=1 Tax=Mytilus galloprovincialis TaxID=29158 RepID=UPI003F7C0AB0
MEDNPSRYFISHSNKFEDRHLVNDVVIPKLKDNGINIYEEEDLQPGTHVLPAITGLVDKADKTLLFISENSLGSSWCSFELLISLEKSQRTNRLAVVLLLHKIEESQLPHIAVLQEARKIHFDEHNDEWVREVVEGLRETKTIGDIMPAGNVAHGLVWSHYSGFLQYVLPELEKTVKESEWYKNLTEEVRKNVSCKLYELVPRTCDVKYDIPKEDDNIKYVTKFEIETWRSGNYRNMSLKMYSITIEEETCYCMCEFPSVIGTMKVMEDKHLARFSHTYPGGVREEGSTTAAQFTTEDKELQLGRFYYTMNSTLNHFLDCIDTARVLLFNDENKKNQLSKILMDAIKKDLKEENFQEKKFKKGNQPPQIDRLESEEELRYEFQVYVARTDHNDDRQKAQHIMDHLREKGIADSDILDADSFLAGSTWSQKLKAASCKCRWFIFLLTKNALQDKSLNYNVISALGDSIYRRKVRVIPVVDRCENLFIPEALRWITYVPFDINGRHLESLYSIVSGRDIPMETQMVLPAGDVAYGLAWGYVTNYLMKILPEVLNGISPAFEENAVKNFRCPHKLFIVIPKSCSAGNVLNDKQNDSGRIEHFSKTAAVYPFGPGRAFHCNIYKLSPGSFNNEEMYFVGQYAAPVTCLQEMKTWNIAGVNLETMASEANRFYEIVSQLMRNAVPEKAQYCEFIYYDDMTHSLADIMEQKIQSMKD